MQDKLKTGLIYEITSTQTQKKYIGQTQYYKYKNDKPYNYGLSGRWNDHISSSKKTKTPLSLEIKNYGKCNFELKILEENIAENLLDEREAFWIKKMNCVFPNGLNKMKHSRCKHRKETSLQNFYTQTTQKVVIKIIK
jgi:hypothetical protein